LSNGLDLEFDNDGKYLKMDNWTLTEK
jgi:hypothetical protein